MENGSRFDASSDPHAGRAAPEETGGGKSGSTRAPGGSGGRPFLGIRFECCKTYGRIYRNDARTEYTGRCPKCQARVTVPIGEGGTSSRFFNAS